MELCSGVAASRLLSCRSTETTSSLFDALADIKSRIIDIWDVIVGEDDEEEAEP
jgi:hypothetical protein